MQYKLLCALFLATTQLFSMEENVSNTCTTIASLPKEIFEYEICPNISKNTTKKNDLLNLKKDFFYPYNKEQNIHWPRHHYWGNDVIFLQNPEIVFDENRIQYKHLINVFPYIEEHISQIYTAQKMACVNKSYYQSFYHSMLETKIELAKYILFHTDYDGHIFNMKEYNQSNDFLLRKEHYMIANAIGWYVSWNKNLHKHMPVKIQLIMSWVLWSSRYTYDELKNFTQERKEWMADSIPTNETLNIFILYLFKGMLQPLKNKKYSFILDANRSKKGPNLDNTNYIKDTAEKMGIEVEISYESFFYHDASEPCIITISESEKNKSDICTIQ